MSKITKAKLEILELAYSSIAAIIEEGSREVDDLEWKLSIIEADGHSLEYKEHVLNELSVSRSYLNDWKNKMDIILDWEHEINQ